MLQFLIIIAFILIMIAFKIIKIASKSLVWHHPIGFLKWAFGIILIYIIIGVIGYIAYT